MATFELTKDGATYQVDAPDEGAALAVFGQLTSSPTASAAPASTFRGAGLAARAAVQGAPSMALGLPALANDAIQQAAQFGYRGIDALAGTDFAARHERGRGGTMGTSRALGHAGEMAADVLGLPKPETGTERVAVAGGQAGLEALGGAGLARRLGQSLAGGSAKTLADELAAAPRAQAAVSAPVGAGAQIAVENEANPLLGMGAGLGAGVFGLAGVQAAERGVQAGQRMLATPGARQGLAEQRLARAADDPARALDALDAAPELVPGSKPTLFQATGDLGLGSLEREVQTANPARFAERRAEQNSARLEQMRGLQADGQPERVVTFLKSQMDAIEAGTQRDVETAMRAAQDKAAQLGGTLPAEEYGRTMRSVLQAGEDAARRRESALWDAVDADGLLTVPMLPTRQAVHEIYGDLAQAKQIGLKPVERQILEVVGGYDAIEPFREIVGLRSALSSAMREELRNAGRTEAYGRMAALRSGLESNILNAAKSKAAAEFDSFNGGSMSFEDTIAGRLQRESDEWRARAAERRNAGADTQSARLVSGGEGAFPPASSGEVPGRSADAAGNRPVSAPAGRESQGLSLTQFIAKNGGVALDADARHYGWDQAKVGGYGRLARPGGVPVDRLRERLMEEGYLRPEPDGSFSRDIRNELYELVDAELKAGRKTYPLQHEGRMGPGADPDADLAQAARQIVREHEAAGIRVAEMDRGAVEEAAELLARGEETDALTAYERAVIRREGEGEPAVLSRPEPAPYTPKSAAPLPNALELDEAGYGRLKAASDATRERARTYGAGVPGQILRKAGDSAASYRMPDANVAANVFRPGRDGGERLRGFLASTRNSTEAREAVQEYAAASLRKAALKDDGTIDPARLSRWRNQHAEALSELPVTVRAKFSDAGRAANALAEATARRKEQIQAYQRSVLGKVAGIDPDDLPRVLGRILGSDDAAAKTRLLLREVKKDPDALKGLRRAVAEYVQERFISNKEVAASGENAIRADALQSFVRKARPALTQILEPQGIRTLEAIADDIARSERSLSALKIPGGSNTAQDTARFFEKLANPNLSIFAQISAAAAPAMALQNYKAAAGTAAAVGVKALLSKVRSAGMQKVDDLVVEMMLDPALARAALTRAANPAANEKLFTRLLERSVASGALYGAAP